MSHIHPRGGLLCIINVCRQQGLHRRHCRNQQLHINTTKCTQTHTLTLLLVTCGCDACELLHPNVDTVLSCHITHGDTLHRVGKDTKGNCAGRELFTDWTGNTALRWARKCSFVSPVCPPPEADVWASVSIDTSQLQGSIRKMSVGTPAPREVFSEKCL